MTTKTAIKKVLIPAILSIICISVGGSAAAGNFREVTEHLPDIKIHISEGKGYQDRHSHPTPKLCVAPLPQEFYEDEEDINPDAGNQCGSSRGTSRESPFGKVLSAARDLYGTNQYSLEYWFIKQVTESPLTVSSCEEADIVYVPLNTLCSPAFGDTAGFGYEEIGIRTAEFIRNARTYLPYLNSKPHFIVISRVQAVYDSLALDFAGLRKAGNFTFLTIEASGEFESDAITVPYPCRYHGHAGLNGNRFIAQAKQEKSHLAFQSYVTRTDMRKALKESCVANPECIHLELEADGYFDFLHNANEWFRNASSSWFCIQPPGTTATRKATFDCLAAGSIPVFFDRESLEKFPWIDVLDPKKLVMIVDDKGALGSALYSKVLKEAASEKGRRYLDNIEQYHHIFQYSMTPQSGLVRWDNVHEINAFDDAFTFSLKSLIRKWCDQKLLPLSKCSRKNGL